MKECSAAIDCRITAQPVSVKYRKPPDQMVCQPLSALEIQFLLDKSLSISGLCDALTSIYAMSIISGVPSSIDIAAAYEFAMLNNSNTV